VRDIAVEKRAICALLNCYNAQGGMVNKLHIAIATNNIEETIKDYTTRLGVEPCSFIVNEYALWRTEALNFSVRQDSTCKPGELRHLGWEDPSAQEFSQDTDINGIIWERFSAKQQADEINEIWPEANFIPE
jgi:catechol 2,3-dioxygenase-like lactoylglutathione lyase family enzyme